MKEKKSKLKFLNKLATYLLTIVVILIFVRAASASSLDLKVNTDDIGVLQQFKIDVLINPDNENINALEGELIFSSDKIKLLEILTGDSVINFWVEEPRLENGVIVFSGIIPGGFEGVLQPYSQTREPGKVFSLIFQAQAGGEAVINFNKVRVLLNDGAGTESLVKASSSTIIINQDLPKEGVLVERELDYDAPEKFYPLITRDENLLDNQYVLIFSAQDKNSGIAEYFVYESQNQEAPSKIEKDKWIKASSPYLLEDQELTSYVYIKAVDKAGNERVETINSQNETKNYENYQKLAIIVIGLIIFIFVSRFLWQKINALKK